MNSTPDAILIRDCQRGDQNAWAELVQRYGRLVYSVPRRYGLPQSDADDVFAAVWAAAFKSLNQLRDDTRLSSWLITMAHRETWRVGKRNKAVATSDFEGHFDNLATPSEELVQRWEEQNLVHRALEKLGGRCKDLLTALFLEQGSPNYESIADRLGMPVGSIGPTRSRCFAKLQQILLDMGYSASEWDSTRDSSDSLSHSV